MWNNKINVATKIVPILYSLYNILNVKIKVQILWHDVLIQELHNLIFTIGDHSQDEFGKEIKIFTYCWKKLLFIKAI
jgi:hypothetical protein